MDRDEVARAAEASDLRALEALGKGDLLWDFQGSSQVVARVWLVDDLSPDLILLWTRPKLSILASLRRRLFPG